MRIEETRLVRIFGYRDTLSLDSRHRFRLPDNLAANLYQEQGRVSAGTDLPPAALQKLAFYFVPGTSRRVFLYPASNIEIAIARFESPPAGENPEEVRTARDYFYGAMTFVEADRQSRLQIPDHLLQHGDMDGNERQIVLVSHNHWLSIAKASIAAELDAKGREALDKVGPNVLDPVEPRSTPSVQDGAEA